MGRREDAKSLEPYLPRFAAEWELDHPHDRWREFDGTCCFVDISGFTALSERLARRGRIGAEELTEVLNHVFSRMLGVAYEKGGSLLKFGGDALLLAFTRDDHAQLGAEAAVAMRATLVEARTLPTSVGRVHLRMSVGLHTGSFHFFRVGSSHHELIVAGPAATTTTRMESTADAGEILVSEATAARLPARAIGATKGEGRLLRWRKPVAGGPGPTPTRDVAAGVIEASIPVGLRVRLSSRTSEPEHRLASVAFVKYQGTDDLLASEGPDATAAALDEVVRTVQDAADAEQVTFLASDIDANGGKIILTAGVPIAQEDDEGRILRAARRILERPLPLPVRVGVNRGHVFSGDIGTDVRRTFTVMGDTVNLAARLMAAATPGSVYSTADVLDSSRTRFATEALEPFMVKGKSEPVHAYAVGASTGVRTNTYESLPFAGRAQELRFLQDAFSAARAGHGSVIVIEAERGVGKTRLVAELAASLPETPVLALQGEPFGLAVPYHPLRAPLRELLGIDGDRGAAGPQLVLAMRKLVPALIPLAPLLAPVVDAELSPTVETAALAKEFVRDRVGELVVAVIDAAFPDGVLILAEDAHWFDDTSSEICGRLADAARSRPVLLCATRRVEAGGFDPATADVHMQLTPLPGNAARDLVEAATTGAPLRPQARDGIVARAGGNPLFLEELVRIARTTDGESLPDSLDAVAMREIDALPATARRVLRLASVLGGSFDQSLLTQLLSEEEVGSEPELLQGLEGQLVAEGGGRVRFRHALLQEAAYQSLPFRTRLALHRRAGMVIERLARSVDDVAPMLSLHFLEAQDWERTWRYARVASELALRAHAPGEAVTHLERAVTAARKLRTIPDEEIAPLLVDLGETLLVMGIYERADDAYARAGRAAAKDPIDRGRIAERRAYLRGAYQGRLAAAIRQVRTGAAILDELPAADLEADRVRAALLAREADVRNRQGRLTEAVALSQAAARAAEQVGEQQALALALTVLDSSLVELGRPGEATHMTRALEVYEALGDHLRVAMTLGNLGGISYFESKWVDAADYFTRAAEAATAAGDLATAAIAQTNLGEIRVNQGRLAEAEALLAPALRTLESFEFRPAIGVATLHLGRARALQGKLEEGIALMRAAAATFEDIQLLVGSLDAHARLAEALVFGDRAEAATALAEARQTELALGETPLSALVDRIDATLAAAIGDRDRAAAMLDPGLERARRLGASYDVLVLLVLGERLGVVPETDEALRLTGELDIVELPVLPDL